jgi:site-specific DNA-cytosine methylase
MGISVRTVDLFCGCGGLALGFELHRGEVTYQTVLAADIDPAALRIFNSNLDKRSGRVATGRRCDLSWFTHRAEFLLYYLAHFAVWQPDADLASSLYKLGFGTFLSRVRHIDDEFDTAVAAFAVGEEGYAAAWQKVDPAVSNLALFKTALKKLGLKSLRKPELDRASLPWTEEYQVAACDATPAEAPHPSLIDSATTVWRDQIERFEDTASKSGRGQHRTVATRMAGVSSFMRSETMRSFRDLWVRWRATRDTVRANFCLSVHDSLERLYVPRKVDLVLGGPPCKGWSRIGRAVIGSLRAQGVHAWASSKYGDERNALLHNYVLVLDALRPAAFLFENVAHFESSLEAPDGAVNAAAVLTESLRSLATRYVEFEIESRVVRANDHAIPQYRHRFIMVGIRKPAIGSAVRLSSMFFDGLPRFDVEVPLKVALSGLDEPGVFDPRNPGSCSNRHRVPITDSITDRLPPAVKLFVDWVRQPSIDGVHIADVDAHIVRKGRDDDAALYDFLAPGKRWMDYKLDGMPTLERLRDLLARAAGALARRPAPGISAAEIEEVRVLLDDSFWLRLLLEAVTPRTSEPHHLIGSGYLLKGADRHGDWLERLPPDRPSKTIVAHIGKDTYGYIHPYQARPLSVREAARIQTFPDFFAFTGAGVVDAYAMIGNAVPPLLAMHFATAFESLQAAGQIFEAADEKAVMNS